jgi:hypothetical protein
MVELAVAAVAAGSHQLEEAAALEEEVGAAIQAGQAETEWFFSHGRKDIDHEKSMDRKRRHS